MRLSAYLESVFLDAAASSFPGCDLWLFGSRTDDRKRGGDFDLAVKGPLSHDAFQKGRTRFFKELLMKDLDLPIDLIAYEEAGEVLRDEIDRHGILLRREISKEPSISRRARASR
ncbi:nucleotidyltransferase family protein [Nitratifractor sp.]